MVPHSGDATTRGVIYALLGAFCAAAYFMPYKAAMGLVSPATFVFMLYLFGFLFSFIGGLIGRADIWLDRSTIIGGVVLGTLSVIAHVSIGQSLEGIDPALTTVMVRTQILFVLVLESTLLQIPAAPMVRICSLIALSGIAVMNIAPDVRVAPEIGFYGWGILAAACFGLMQLYIKRYNTAAHPVTLNYCRLFFGMVILAMVPGAVPVVSELSWTVIGLVAVAALLGPVLSRTWQIYALKTLSPSQVVLVDMLAPVFAVCLAYGLLGTWPTGLQLLGGAIMMVSIIMPLLWPWFSRHGNAAATGTGMKPPKAVVEPLAIEPVAVEPAIGQPLVRKPVTPKPGMPASAARNPKALRSIMPVLTTAEQLWQRSAERYGWRRQRSARR